MDKLRKMQIKHFKTTSSRYIEPVYQQIVEDDYYSTNKHLNLLNLGEEYILSPLSPINLDRVGLGVLVEVISP